jgi:hypothetical protein
VSPENIRALRESYYEIRGWDAEGKPTPETLEELKITGFRLQSSVLRKTEDGSWVLGLGSRVSGKE